MNKPFDSNDVAVVISHKNCWDGSASAWVADQYFQKVGRHWNLFYCQYGDAPPADEELSGRDVYILDFSFPRETLQRLETVCRTLTVLDHHHTAKEALEGLSCCTFDMERAGCQLAWDHFFPGVDRPTVIQQIADRDLWKWKMPYSKEVSATLTGIEPSIDEVECYAHNLYGNNFDATVSEGYSLIEFFNRIYEKALDKAFYVNILGTQVLMVQGAHVLASELGNYVASRSKSNIACVYSVGEIGTTLSFRTVGGVDATPLAKYFGGGGHKAACGAKVSHDLFAALLNQNKPSIFEVMP